MAQRKRDRHGRFTRAPALINAPPVTDITSMLKRQENRSPPERQGYTAPAKAGVVQAPSLKVGAPAAGAPRPDSNQETNHPGSKQPSPCSIASSSSSDGRDAGDQPRRPLANHKNGPAHHGGEVEDAGALISNAAGSRPNSLEVWNDQPPETPQQPSTGIMAQIDQKFSHDPLNVPEYRREIFCHLVDSATRNRISPHTLAERQPNVSEYMRAVLLGWIWGVHDNLLGESGEDSTLHLTVHILDAYLSVAPEIITPIPHLQLIGAACYFIATKYEQTYPPKITALARHCAEASGDTKITQCEQMILEALDFRITVPTSYHFFLRFVELARSGGSEQSRVHTRKGKRPRGRAEWFCEVGLLHSRTLAFPRHILAAASICLDRAVSYKGNSPTWPTACQQYSGLTLEELAPCCLMLIEIILREREKEAPSLPRYSSSRSFYSTDVQRVAHLFKF